MSLRIFVMSPHSEDMIVTYVEPDDTIAHVKKGFEGAGNRNLVLDGQELDDDKSVHDSCIVADCTIVWTDDTTTLEHSPDSGFLASNVSGAFVVSRNGSVTSARRSSCPPEAEQSSPIKPAGKVCNHWLEAGTCPFGERCHFSFTHTEENAGRDHAVCLAGKPVCKHWVAEGKCPLKSCFWKATHKPQNSPRYAKYLKATPFAPCATQPTDSTCGVAAPQSEDPTKDPTRASMGGHGPITVMKRQSQPNGTGAMPGPPQPSPAITVMKRQPPVANPRSQPQQYHGATPKPAGHHGNKHNTMRGMPHLGGADPNRAGVYNTDYHTERAPHPASHRPPAPIHSRGGASVQRPGPLPASFIHKKPQQQRGAKSQHDGGSRGRRGKPR
eukprot:TRINITY_DN25627_c0_g1_i6.p1 TRINITY_DN25627_c0_g1~~TRINITY_DN25627_c0_g1_i6.p1  ORF type:complete len:384 (-),score=18.25 TRINITY_DN25627_c0_g1_i6:548-1699(-)